MKMMNIMLKSSLIIDFGGEKIIKTDGRQEFISHNKTRMFEKIKNFLSQGLEGFVIVK
jgi:hypothetical protein